MLLTKLDAATAWFQVFETTDRCQTAVMNLTPGAASGDEAEQHEKSDQVLLVLEGEVVAEIAGETARMTAGEAVVIPAGTPHRFCNDGKTMVRTFNVYAPAAYPAGERG